MNVLSEATSDRTAKRRSLERIQAELLGGKATDPHVLELLFASVLKPILKVLGDPVEKCRELSISIICGFAKLVKTPISVLPYVVPAFTDRLGQPEIVEPSEENRLLMVQTLVVLVDASQTAYAPFVEETVKILQQSLADNFPEVKKESCNLVIGLSSSNSRALALHGDVVSKAILPCLYHRHSSVRKKAIDALCAAILVDATGLDDSVEALRTLTYDKASIVRQTVYAVARRWLMELIDRYSYGHKVLPLLLAGMTDDMPDLRQAAFTAMEDVGALYEKEWESRVKDESDYSDGIAIADRPRVGSRNLARDNIQKVVGKLIEGLGDWNLETRAKSAQILRVFTKFTEDQITGYIGTILPALYKILAGDEVVVMDAAVSVAEAIGSFVDPDTPISLLLPQIAMGGGGATSFRLGCLRTLNGVLRGTKAALLAPQYPRLLDMLMDREIVQTENCNVLLEVSRITFQLVSKLEANTDEITFKLFFILVQLQSAQGNEKVPGFTDLQNEVMNAQQLLTSFIHVESTTGLYQHFFDATIDILSSNQPAWTKHSLERRLLDTVLLNSGIAVGSRLEKVLPIFSGCSNPNRDYEVREGAILLMTRLVRDANCPLNSQNQLSSFSDVIMKDIVLANSIWRAGKKATILRMEAMDLFLALVQHGNINSETCCGLLSIGVINSLLQKDVLPVLMSNIDDDEANTRRITLNILAIILSSHASFQAVDLKKIYPELLKRMDDAQDTLRIRCAQVWKSFFNASKRFLDRMALLRVTSDESKVTVVQRETGEVIEVALDDVHWDTIIKGLLIHMDDTNSNIQETVCSVIKDGLKLDVLPKEMAHEHLRSIRSKHRSARFVDELLQF